MVEVIAVVLVVKLSVVVVAASIERTAAAMSQWAARMNVRRSDVKDFDVLFTWLIDNSNSSGAGAAATVTSNEKGIVYRCTPT